MSQGPAVTSATRPMLSTSVIATPDSSGGRPALLVYRVVRTDEEALNWKVDDIGNLRVALNALVRVFRLGC